MGSRPTFSVDPSGEQGWEAVLIFGAAVGAVLFGPDIANAPGPSEPVYPSQSFEQTVEWSWKMATAARFPVSQPIRAGVGNVVVYDVASQSAGQFDALVNGRPVPKLSLLRTGDKALTQGPIFAAFNQYPWLGYTLIPGVGESIIENVQEGNYAQAGVDVGFLGYANRRALKIFFQG